MQISGPQVHSSFQPSSAQPQAAFKPQVPYLPGNNTPVCIMSNKNVCTYRSCKYLHFHSWCSDSHSRITSKEATRGINPVLWTFWIFLRLSEITLRSFSHLCLCKNLQLAFKQPRVVKDMTKGFKSPLGPFSVSPVGEQILTVKNGGGGLTVFRVCYSFPVIGCLLCSPSSTSILPLKIHRVWCGSNTTAELIRFHANQRVCIHRLRL